jgi:hypothetical protein
MVMVARLWLSITMEPERHHRVRPTSDSYTRCAIATSLCQQATYLTALVRSAAPVLAPGRHATSRSSRPHSWQECCARTVRPPTEDGPASRANYPPCPTPNTPAARGHAGRQFEAVSRRSSGRPLGDFPLLLPGRGGDPNSRCGLPFHIFVVDLLRGPVLKSGVPSGVRSCCRRWVMSRTTAVYGFSGWSPLTAQTSATGPPRSALSP